MEDIKGMQQPIIEFTNIVSDLLMLPSFVGFIFLWILLKLLRLIGGKCMLGSMKKDSGLCRTAPVRSEEAWLQLSLLGLWLTLLF